jgi:hypothetical protein
MPPKNKPHKEQPSKNPANGTKDNFWTKPRGKFIQGVLIAIVAAPFVAIIGVAINYFITPQPQSQPKPDKITSDKTTSKKNINQSNDKHKVLKTETPIHQQSPPIESRNKKMPSKENSVTTFAKLSTAHTEPPKKPISRGGFIKATNVKGLTIENNTYIGPGDFADLDNVTDVKASGNKHITLPEVKK